MPRIKCQHLNIDENICNCFNGDNPISCSCAGKREYCEFFSGVRAKGISERTYKMNGGMINRKKLITKMWETSRENGKEIPVWILDIIEQMETGRQERNRKMKERNNQL